MHGSGSPSAAVRSRTKLSVLAKGCDEGKETCMGAGSRDDCGHGDMDPDGGADDRGPQDPPGDPGIRYGLNPMLPLDMASGLIPSPVPKPPSKLCLSRMLILTARGTVQCREGEGARPREGLLSASLSPGRRDGASPLGRDVQGVGRTPCS